MDGPLDPLKPILEREQDVHDLIGDPRRDAGGVDVGRGGDEGEVVRAKLGAAVPHKLADIGGAIGVRINMSRESAARSRASA